MLETLSSMSETLSSYQGLYTVIALLISVAVPFVVLRKTLETEKENNRKLLNTESAKLEVQKSNHREILLIRKEELRVSQLPYLFLEFVAEEYSGRWEFDKILFSRLRAKNIGNGSAFGVHPKLCDDLVMCEANTTDPQYRVSIIQRDCMYDSAIPVGYSGVFSIYPKMRGSDGKTVELPERGHQGLTIITLCFKDSLNNKYEQSYKLSFDVMNRDINITDQYEPVLIKANDEQVS